MNNKLLSLNLILIIILITGCSVGMALSGSKNKDTSVIYKGSERSFVIAKLGLPDHSIQDDDGNWVDTYYIKEGNEPSAGRAIGHGVMDVLTLGLWEVIGTPIEAVAGSEDVQTIKIFYDEKDKIVEIERILDIAKPEDTEKQKPVGMPGISQ